jgi:D-amino-acid dehydrogenase
VPPTRVLVVGGGAVGACIALELARRDKEVVLLERDPQVGRGASFGNAGYLIPSHAAPLASLTAIRRGLRWIVDPASPLQIRPRPGMATWLVHFLFASSPRREARGTAVLRRLGSESLELHADLARAGLHTSFERRGILNVYETRDGFSRGQAEALDHRAAGLEVRVLDPHRTVELEPALNGAIAGAVFYPDEASCDPAQFVSAVASAAAAHGARIETGVEVLSLARHGRSITAVETTHGRFSADIIVLAAGVWTDRLARGVGARLRLQGGKGYHIEFAAQVGQPALPVFLQEARVTMTPLAGRLRVTGGLDLTGYDVSVDPRRIDTIVGAARRMLATEATAEVVGIWRGLRPCTPDGLPSIGGVPLLDNLIVCAGHAMLGITLAPVSGRIVADLVDGRSEIDLTPFDPARFARRP